MKKLDRISRIKFSVFLIYYLSFFLPIYSQTIFGTIFKASISEVGAGTFFLIFYLILILTTVILRFAYTKYFKHAYLITVGFMVILLLIFLLFKGDSTLRFAWYLQFVLIGVLILAYFKEEMTLNIFSYIYKTSKKYFSKLYLFIRRSIAKNKNEESIDEEEGDSK